MTENFRRQARVGLLGFVALLALTAAGCESKPAPVVIDTTTPIQQPAAPTANKLPADGK